MLYNFFEQRRSSYKSRQLYVAEVVYKNNDKDDTVKGNLRRKSPHICSEKCFHNQNHTCCQYWCGVASSWNAKKLCVRATTDPTTATKRKRICYYNSSFK